MFHIRDKLRSLRWLFAEVLVVVLGILIAFQIDEWKTQREERRQEIVSLEAISSDLEIGIEEYWPTDPEFGNVLIEYARRIYRVGNIANEAQDTARELRSKISDHVEAIR